jgi:hypothetical protein
LNPEVQGKVRFNDQLTASGMIEFEKPFKEGVGERLTHGLKRIYQKD